jgi:hypothetical protein
MANKQSFTPDEWTKIAESVMMSGIAVSAAEPSGLLGMFKEAFASSSALAASKLDPGSNERSGFQGMAAQHQPESGGGLIRRRLSRHRRCASQRCGEGYIGRHLQGPGHDNLRQTL